MAVKKSSGTRPAIGDFINGGYFAGLIQMPDGIYGIVVAPKAEGEHDNTPWNSKDKRVAGALSFFDGAANTAAMAKAGSALAKWALKLNINGLSDWYVPARDELELCYRAFKPTEQTNYCWRGDNSSSVPVGYAYMPDAPAQTALEAFQEGEAEAFYDTYYWTSTQCAGDAAYAWYQDFSLGGQCGGHKDGKLRARAVRRYDCSDLTI